MTITLNDITLIKRIQNNTNIIRLIILCPLNQALFSSKLPLPLSLFQYHIVPFKLDKFSLDSISIGTEINTFYIDHLLVLATMSVSKSTSLNKIKIKEWNVFNEESLIVHGIESLLNTYNKTLSKSIDVDDHEELMTSFSPSS